MQVFIREDLHAKVYLLGTRAIVASANLSEHSRDSLDEAGLHTSDKQVAREIKEWFIHRMGEPVTPEWLTYCKKVYRPPKIPGQTRSNVSGKYRAIGRRVWLVSTHLKTFPKPESQLVRSGAKAAEARLRDPKQYSVDSIFIKHKRFVELVRQGDLLIERFWQSYLTLSRPGLSSSPQEIAKRIPRGLPGTRVL